jgi:hypothetical protein
MDIEGNCYAIELLKADHDKVRAAFREYATLEANELALKGELVNTICSDLINHATVEEEFFYPAIQQGSEEARELIFRALDEHANAKALIVQLQQLSPEDDGFDTTVLELSEQIELHVDEEEHEIFPLAGAVDLAVLGKYMAERKMELERDFNTHQSKRQKAFASN